jgi:uncharacterized membrane protein YraQ (UPF0718 family)
MQTSAHDSRSNTNRKRLRWLFPICMIAVYLAIYLVAPDGTVNALMASGNILKQMALPMLLAFVMMIMLNLFISPVHVSRFLGRRAGIKGALLSSVAGILSMGPVYAWLPFLAEIREKGASDFCVANYLSNRAVKPVLLPLMIGYFGWRFSMIFTLLNMVGALLVAAAVFYICEGRTQSQRPGK